MSLRCVVCGKSGGLRVATEGTKLFVWCGFEDKNKKSSCFKVVQRMALTFRRLQQGLVRQQALTPEQVQRQRRAMRDKRNLFKRMMKKKYDAAVAAGVPGTERPVTSSEHPSGEPV